MVKSILRVLDAVLFAGMAGFCVFDMTYSTVAYWHGQHDAALYYLGWAVLNAVIMCLGAQFKRTVVAANEIDLNDGD